MRAVVPGSPRPWSSPMNDEKPIAVSFEFFPPKTPEAETALWQAIRKLEAFHPSYVSITYGAGGSTQDATLATVTRIACETGLSPAPHLTCVGKTKQEVDEVVRTI